MKIIILGKERSKYDWEFYTFLLDNEILLDLTVFKIEFNNEDNMQKFDKKIVKYNFLIIRVIQTKFIFYKKLS